MKTAILLILIAIIAIGLLVLCFVLAAAQNNKDNKEIEQSVKDKLEDKDK